MRVDSFPIELDPRRYQLGKGEANPWKRDTDLPVFEHKSFRKQIGTRLSNRTYLGKRPQQLGRGLWSSHTGA